MTSPDPRLAAATLRALAEKATPGPWRVWMNCLYGQVMSVEGTEVTMNDEHGACWIEDANFIAAANPAVVISLLDALAAAEGELRRLLHWTPEHTIEEWLDEVTADRDKQAADNKRADGLLHDLMNSSRRHRDERDALAARLAAFTRLVFGDEADQMDQAKLDEYIAAKTHIASHSSEAGGEGRGTHEA